VGLKANLKLTGILSHSVGAALARLVMGTGPAPDGRIDFADGTGAGQANQIFLAPFSIPATTRQSYDLKGGGGEVDVLNRALAMTKVKLVYVELTAPAAAQSVQFGPAAVTNAAILWYQAATANFYSVVRSKLLQADEVTGWALDGTHKVISLYNPELVTVAGKILVVGTM
jgi:hypothetical protein